MGSTHRSSVSAAARSPRGARGLALALAVLCVAGGACGGLPQPVASTVSIPALATASSSFCARDEPALAGAPSSARVATEPPTFALTDLLPGVPGAPPEEVDLGVVTLPSPTLVLASFEQTRAPFVEVAPRAPDEATLAAVVGELPPRARAPWSALRALERELRTAELRHAALARRASLSASPPDAVSPESRRCADWLYAESVRHRDGLGAALEAARAEVIAQAEASWASAARSPGAVFVWAYAREGQAQARDAAGAAPEADAAREAREARDALDTASAYESFAQGAAGTRLGAFARERAARIRAERGQPVRALALFLEAARDPQLSPLERGEAWMRAADLESDPVRAADALTKAADLAPEPPLATAIACKLSTVADDAERYGAALLATAACARALGPEAAADLAARIAELASEHPDLPELARVRPPRSALGPVAAELARRAVERMDLPALVAVTEGARRLGHDVGSLPTRAADWPAKERAARALRILTEACPPREPLPRDVRVRITVSPGSVRVASAPATRLTKCFEEHAWEVVGPPLVVRVRLRERRD